MNSLTRRILSSVNQALAVFGLVAITFVTSSFRLGELVPTELKLQAAAADDTADLGAWPLVVPTIRYGIEVERYGDFEETDVAAGVSLSRSLRDAGLSRKAARGLVWEASLEYDGTKRLPAHRRVTVTDLAGDLALIFIEVNELEFLRFDVAAGTASLEDADGIASEFEVMTLFYAGDVDSMLAETSFDGQLANVVREALTEEMPLDEEFRVGLIKLIYTAKKDELGVTRGYGAVEALRYGIGEAERTAYRFCDDGLDVEGFFNTDGTPAVRTWLKSPVVKGHMSSPFNLRRKHPVLRRVKPHYGTDYAANYGEPILALSDGVVVAKARNAGNGNFVKIEHDATYATQYLHMKGFAPGLRPGQHVRKGDVIGYVGSTGLSSGPHVCLRFWKHGQQVDFRRELRRLPTTSSLGSEAMTAFSQRQAELGSLLEPRT